MKIKKLIIFFVLFFSTLVVKSQNLTYSFTDPCTREITNFTFPLQQGQNTIIFFLGQQRTFTASDVASGAFASWISQTYSEFRKVVPCSVQSTTVVRNQIISQIIGNTVSSVAGSILSSARSEASGNDAASKGKNNSNKKEKKKEDGGNNSNNINSVSNISSTGNGKSDVENSNSSTSNNSGNSGSVVNNSGGNNIASSTNSTGTKESSQGGEEVIGSVTMNVDSKNEKGGGKSKKNNPIIISSDLTSAQNLDRSFTAIINVGMSQSSMTGASSWGVTSMTWFNLKQFAISGRYTKIHFSNNGKLKFIHNVNLTGLYTYGNYMGFVGYSGILNAGKWGVTGLNVSAAATKINEDGNLFLSPSLTAFYTRPFSVGERLTVSPEIYIISTPLIYSSVEKLTVTDRTFSGFVGSGFEYQLTKRFKVNANYKINVSTNPEFPILSFFLIGSKINL
jgi:hypothetical protein